MLPFINLFPCPNFIIFVNKQLIHSKRPLPFPSLFLRAIFTFSLLPHEHASGSNHRIGFPLQHFIDDRPHRVFHSSLCLRPDRQLYKTKLPPFSTLNRLLIHHRELLRRIHRLLHQALERFLQSMASQPHENYIESAPKPNSCDAIPTLPAASQICFGSTPPTLPIHSRCVRERGAGASDAKEAAPRGKRLCVTRKEKACNSVEASREAREPGSREDRRSRRRTGPRPEFRRDAKSSPRSRARATHRP